MALALSGQVIGLARRALRRSLPGATEDEVALRFVELHYGRELAAGLRRLGTGGKLEWFRAEGEVSDRQWADVVGVIRTGGPQLDHDYSSRWAAALGVGDLFDRAWREAGPG
jgi:hypothetical protein